VTPLNSLIFGLGLFFLGLRLIGENLRRLVGSGFREVIKRSTHSPALGAGLGLATGALMQSATAVTFILVSMTGSGLIKPAAAAPIIIWCNVGLTALAFVATLNIHPIAALVVGGAGIVMGTMRNVRWQTIAGAVLGLGLIIIGLEQMSTGAAPLKDTPWFREAMAAAVANPLLAFLAGVAAAAILQSNTGTAMLVITLAAGGLIGLKPAMLMIYGANLGAIGLRLFLSAGLHGVQLRLVRLEDLFCVVSGFLMLVLYALEAEGIPLAAAFVTALPAALSIKLAVVFLLSNLLPALLMSPLLGVSLRFLEKLWPDKPAAEDLARPLFLHSRALDDPSTALDLLGRELARLLGTIQVDACREGAEDLPPADFQSLALAIEKFIAQLASRNTLDEQIAQSLHLRRAELSIIRHVEEGVRYFSEAMKRHGASPVLSTALAELLALATRSAAENRPELIAELREKTKLNSEAKQGLKEKADVSNSSLDATARFEDFAMAVWTLRHLAKLLSRISE